jgi:hypothetical protein
MTHRNNRAPKTERADVIKTQIDFVILIQAGSNSRGGRILLRLRHTLFKSDGDMPPHLDRKNHRGRQQQRPNRNVRYRRGHHRELRLSGVPTPGDAGEKRSEAKTKLRD